MQTFYFTFGSGQTYEGCFILIEALTREEARTKMFDMFEDKWSMQYEEEEWVDRNGVSQEERYCLTEI